MARPAAARSAIRIIRYPRWNRFLSEFCTELFSDGVFRNGKYLFRGMGSSEDRLTTSFDVQFSDVGMARTTEAESIERLFRERAAKLLPDTVGADEILAIGRHFGLPTRVLDWSSNPFVSLYFAFRAAVVARKDRGYVALWALNRQDIQLWDESLGVKIIRPSARENTRLASQDGFFTYLRTPSKTIEEYVEAAVTDGRTGLWKFEIQARFANEALSFLDAMGINAARLFPDLEGAVWDTLLQYWLQKQNP